MSPDAGFAARWWPRLVVTTLVVNIGIVVTGAAVRVTGSGLGCPEWPRCTPTSYRAHPELGIHGAIEFGNRLLTFVLVAVAIATFVAALRVGTRRAQWLSFVVGLGIPLQAVIGGITVLTSLNPYVVALHLLATFVIIVVAVTLLDEVMGPERPAAAPAAQRLTWLIVGTGSVTLYLGTVVTGSGPHAGDAEARRTGLDPQVMSHVHAASVYVLLALTLGLVVLARRSRSPQLASAAGALLALEIAQGVVGFVQYELDLPESLVVLHLLGAALTAAALTWQWRSARPLVR